MNVHGNKALLKIIGIPEEEIDQQLEEMLFPYMHQDNPDLLVADLLIDWWIYANSSAGKGIQHRARFVVKAVKDGRKPPLHRVDPEEAETVIKALILALLPYLLEEIADQGPSTGVVRRF